MAHTAVHHSTASLCCRYQLSLKIGTADATGRMVSYTHSGTGNIGQLLAPSLSRENIPAG